MASGFTRFNIIWANQGIVLDPTNAQADAGFAYLGPTPPSVELFNALEKWDDEKDNWLYNQIANVILGAGLPITEGNLNSLRDAINSKITTATNAYVRKVGDTMTGFLTLNAAPTAALHAATKAYVDAQRDPGGPFLPLAGGAMTGRIDINGAANGINYDPPTALVNGVWGVNNIAFGWGGANVGLRVRVDATDVGTIPMGLNAAAYVKIAGSTMTGLLTLSGAPTTNLHAVTKAYADTKAPLASPVFTGNPTAPTPATGDNDTSIATTAFVKVQGYGVGANYVRKVGDVMTGLLTLSGAPTANLHAATKAYVDTRAPLASPVFTGNPSAPTAAVGDNDTTLATTAFVTRAVGSGGTGTFVRIVGDTMTGFLTLNAGPTANLHAATKAYVDTRAPLASPLFTGDPRAPTPAAADNDTSIATTAWVTTKVNSTVGAYVRKAGDTMTGQLVGTSVSLSGNVDAATVNANGDVNCDEVRARAGLFPDITGAPGWVIAHGTQAGVSGCFNIYDATFWDCWAQANGGWAWWRGAVAEMSMISGNLFITTEGFKPVGGPWIASSDVRIKRNIKPYTKGLDVILKLQPKSFTFIPQMNYPDKTYVGLVANDVQPILPDAVSKMEIPFNNKLKEVIKDELLTYNGNEVTYALINAVKELATRVATLEGKFTT